ncbi:MAG: hypothetical protein M3065_02260 [Actinomycetota bacterium]|nr:hypothetical protein [Actinomycetota bacterium]
MSSVVYIPWYAAVLRHDALAEAVAEIAPVALRYGATKYAVHRSRDDRYKITQMAWFESDVDWHKYWEGPEMIEFRAANSGRFQVPIVYVWHDELTVGEIVTADETVSAA